MNNNLNGIIIGGLAINTIFSLLFISSQEHEFVNIITILLTIPLLISYIGVYMVSSKQLKWGYRLIIIGSALFAPIGLIAILGVNKAKKAQELSYFEKRKKELE